MPLGESKKIDSSLCCPACQEPLRPMVLGCDGCGIKVEGPFQLNEFATLSADDLHFLRIFVLSEGRVRDMQSALGLSYPTVRARLTQLKNKLVGIDISSESSFREASKSGKAGATDEVLDQLAKGEIDFDEAMRNIRKLPKNKKG
ncbi:DUF2089 domain-containing protein [Leptospira brenneri]|nr:DUF2089 family protein [Leptospira brenneri]